MARAAELAYSTVRDRIINGVYAGGSRITEQEIADSTGVSRTPVREALRRLQAEGFIKVTANHGAIVTEWSAQDVHNVFELRALLEPYGAACAARRITSEVVAELRRLAEAQYAESQRRAPGYVVRIRELNSAFHRLILAHSGNQRLAAMLPALMEAPLVLKTFSKYRSQDLLRSASHHLEIVSALEARDPEWAASIMRSHILAAHTTFRNFSESLEPEVVDPSAERRKRKNGAK
ncbi:MAG TPA: GntR family transcriptional regulator [Steroidobacteraceae bacterium]